MKIRMERDVMAEAVAWAARSLPSRPSVPILAGLLIKADAHFTKRAIGAWRGLGFQLIIGAPNDKYSAIEPHVDAEYDILKDTRGRSWAKPKVALPASPA